MRYLLRIAIFTAAALAPSALLAQLPPGYWSYYDSAGANYHQKRSHYELQRQRAPIAAAHEPWVDRRSADPMDYNGRGMTGRGLSSYQSNGYSGPNQNLYYGYSDGGFMPGLYGFSMYAHFDRPGFTYWQN